MKENVCLLFPTGCEAKTRGLHICVIYEIPSGPDITVLVSPPQPLDRTSNFSAFCRTHTHAPTVVPTTVTRAHASIYSRNFPPPCCRTSCKQRYRLYL